MGYPRWWDNCLAGRRWRHSGTFTVVHIKVKKVETVKSRRPRGPSASRTVKNAKMPSGSQQSFWSSSWCTPFFTFLHFRCLCRRLGPQPREPRRARQGHHQERVKGTTERSPMTPRYTTLCHITDAPRDHRCHGLADRTDDSTADA